MSVALFSVNLLFSDRQAQTLLYLAANNKTINTSRRLHNISGTHVRFQSPRPPQILRLPLHLLLPITISFTIAETREVLHF
jgi:hypothetical protein